MLQIIIIEGQTQDQSTKFTELDLYPDTKINVVWENPLFLFDEIAAMFSLSFNLPTTPKNLLLFSYPNRIPIVSEPVKYNALIKHSGLQIAFGELILFQFNKDIQTQFVGSVEITKLPLSKIDLGEKDFGVAPYSISSFGETIDQINYQDAQWADYLNTAINNSQDNPDNDFFIAPVKLINAQWDGPEGVNATKNSLLQYINFFNAKDKTFIIEDNEKCHTPVIPFLCVYKIIDTILGDDLFENPFTVNDFKRLVLVGSGHKNYSPDLYHTSTLLSESPTFMQWFQDLQVREFLMPVSENAWIAWLSHGSHDLVWNYSSFMHNYACNEFLKDILKIFSMTLFRIGRKFHLEFNNDIFTRDVCHPWNAFLHHEPSVIREKAKNYNFNYSESGTRFNENVRELSSWNVVYEEAIKSQHNQEYFYKVPGNPQILSITKAFVGEQGKIRLYSKIVKSALESDQELIHEETVSISSKIKPLDMNIERYWWESNHVWWPDFYTPPDIFLNKEHWHVPVIGDINKDSAPSIMLFGGRKPTFSSSVGLAGNLNVALSFQSNPEPHDPLSVELHWWDDNQAFAQQGADPVYILEYTIYQNMAWIFLEQVHIDQGQCLTTVRFSSEEIDHVTLRVFAVDQNGKFGPSGFATKKINEPATYMENTGGSVDEYPYLTNHHTDQAGVKHLDFSLLPNTDGGIQDVFHEEFKQWMEQDKIRVNALFNLPISELVKVDMRDKILLDGKKFFIEKLQFTLHTDHISKTEASLISSQTTITEQTP